VDETGAAFRVSGGVDVANGLAERLWGCGESVISRNCAMASLETMGARRLSQAACRAMKDVL